MADVCNDNRFEMIKRVKEMLIEGTNIETRPEEMAVLDSILFRFWQLGWLKHIGVNNSNSGSFNTDRTQQALSYDKSRQYRKNLCIY